MERLLYVCAGACGRLKGKEGSLGFVVSLCALLVLQSFRKHLILATLVHSLAKTDGFRQRAMAGEVRCPGAYSLIKRGRKGRHPTMIPLAISADLKGQSVCTNMIVEMCFLTTTC